MLAPIQRVQVSAERLPTDEHARNVPFNALEMESLRGQRLHPAVLDSRSASKQCTTKPAPSVQSVLLQCTNGFQDTCVVGVFLR